MEVKIRYASEKDGEFVAWIMLTAARSGKTNSFWDLFLYGDDKEKIKFISKMALSDTKTMCHYSYFLIADVDGVPAGGVACYYPNGIAGEPFRMVAKEVWDELGYTEEQLIKSRERAAIHFSCMPNYPDDVWILEFVALKPEFRKKGIMNQLLTKAIIIGKEKGAARFQITVAKGNTPAQKAYAKAGFVKKEEITSPEFQKVFGYEGTERLVIEA